MRIFCSSIVVLSLFLSACSEYARVVKNDDYKRKYELGVKLFEQENYPKAITLLEQVYQRTPKTSEGENSYYSLGIANYRLGDYYTAQYYLASFGDKYPASVKREETSFLYALCSVNNSPSASLDQAETETALNELQLFIYKFPQSDRIDTCNKLMDQLRFKLQYKDYESLKVYDRTENYKAAIVTSETFLKEFPASIYRENVWEILINNSYQLAKHSVEDKKKERIDKTMERYSKFVLEFPNSKRSEELKNLIGRLI
jgi:outer membrane protein assembly factor BamD